MAAKTPSEDAPPPEDKQHASRIDSRVFVVFLILGILGGTAAWNSWDLLGTQGFDPKEIKKMASDYDGECYRATKDERGCKRHIGRRHRNCMELGIVREEGKPISYDYEAYRACMVEHRDADLADKSKKR